MMHNKPKIFIANAIKSRSLNIVFAEIAFKVSISK